MASMEKHGRNWRVVWREDGRKTDDRFATEAEAKVYKALVETNGNRRPTTAELDQRRRFTSSAPVRFEDFAWDWFAAKSGTQAYTKHRVKRDIELYLIPAFGEKFLQQLSPQDDGRWINDLQSGRYGAKLRPATIAQKHGLMTEIMNAAVWYYPHALIPRNPFASQGKSKGRKLPKIVPIEMAFLLHEDFWRLHDTALPWAKPVYLTLVTTGLRLGELSGLPVGNVNLKAKTLTVSQTLHAPTHSEPLTSIEHYWHIGPPKSKAAYRTIAISDETCAALAPLMVGKKEDDLIFSAPGRTGTGGNVSANYHGAHFIRPVVEGQTMSFTLPVNALKEPIVWRNLKGATGKSPRVGLLERVGIAQQFRIHDFRHTHVAWCANENPPIPLDVVSRRLGHRSIAITYDRYNHLYPGRDRAAAAAMDAALARPGTGDNVIAIRRNQA